MFVKSAEILCASTTDPLYQPYKKFVPQRKALQPKIFFVESGLIGCRNAAGHAIKLGQVFDPASQREPPWKLDAVDIDAEKT